jgi:hypothetical protein
MLGVAPAGASAAAAPCYEERDGQGGHAPGLQVHLAYVSIRQHTSATPSIRPHTSAYVSQGGHAPGLQVLTLLALLVLGLLALLALLAMKGVMAREVTQLVLRYSVYLLY